ncbi:MAG: hypothetical protein ABI402_07220 [Ferruginibacter sp.]
MKLRRSLLFIVCFHIMMLCNAQKGIFEISIIQDGNTINPGFTGDVVLNKSPFKISVKLIKLEGVYLYAAFKDSIYKIGSSEPVPGFDGLPSLVMVENEFNPDQEMVISNEGWAYWYYDPKDETYRFDKDIYKEGDMVTGTKTIRQFYDFASGKEMQVKDVTAPLYLFFFSAEQDKSHNLKKELQRFKLKITWK